MIAMDIIAQIIAKITEVSSILILANGTNGDSLAASLALHNFLKKLDKDAHILSPSSVSDKFKFLPQSDVVAESGSSTRSRPGSAPVTTCTSSRCASGTAPRPA